MADPGVSAGRSQRDFTYVLEIHPDRWDEVITIRGNDASGQYLEFHDKKTGRMIAHKRFTKEEVEAATPRAK